MTDVHADFIQLQQVILNLMRNAIEAMTSIEADKRELIIRTSMPQRDAIEVAVIDCGPAIAAEIQDKLFEPFVTTKPSGLGMGLSICRTIVEAHGGRLSAVPNPDGGMTFRFTVAVTQGD